MISKINVYDEKYYHKKEEYNKRTLVNLLNILKKKRKIVLYSEKIFVKSYEYIGNKFETYVQEKITEDFSNKDNILFHYEVDKKNKLIYLYSLRNDNFKDIYKDAIEFTIEPIQFKIRNKIIKKLGKNKNILVFYRIDNVNNVIYIRKSFIAGMIISKNIEEIKSFIIEKREDEDILVFSKETNSFKEFEDIKIDYFIDLGVNKYENLRKK